MKKATKARTALKQFRIGKLLNQAEMAEKIGVSRALYGYIENGKRGGSPEFWDKLQKSFNVPDEDMYKMMKIFERA